jgi:hypothetical protein
VRDDPGIESEGVGAVTLSHVGIEVDSALGMDKTLFFHGESIGRSLAYVNGFLVAAS